MEINRTSVENIYWGGFIGPLAVALSSVAAHVQVFWDFDTDKGSTLAAG